jgi:hypothetical protein
MNKEKLFGLAEALVRDLPFEGLTTSKQKEKAFHKSIQAFMHSAKAGEKEIQAFTASSDIAQLTKDVFNVTNEVNNYDLGWQRAFRTVDLMKGQLSWEIATASTSAEFKLVQEGGKIEFKGYDGTKVIVEIQKYGMGIGLTWETIEGRKMYQFINELEQTRAKLYKIWADVHYGLLATAGATNQIAWQGTTEGTLERDILTLNKGYEDLGEATKDSGYGDTANAEMVIYAAPKLAARINRALRAQNVDVNASGRTNSGITVDYPITVISTYNDAVPANKALLVLPGNKIQNAVYLENLALSKKDIESLSDYYAYWTAFGATVADSNQVYELAFSA